MNEIILCEERDAAAMYNSGTLKEFVLSYEEKIGTERINALTVKRRYVTATVKEALAVARLLNAEKPWFRIGNRVRWQRQGVERIFQEYVNGYWVDGVIVNTDIYDREFFLGHDIINLCDEDEIIKAYANGKLRILIKAKLEEARRKSCNAFYLFGDNVIWAIISGKLGYDAKNETHFTPYYYGGNKYGWNNLSWENNVPDTISRDEQGDVEHLYAELMQKKKKPRLYLG